MILLGPQGRDDAGERGVAVEAECSLRRPAVGGGMEARQVHAVPDHREASRIEPVAAGEERLVAGRQRHEAVRDRERGGAGERVLEPVVVLAGGVEPHHQARPRAAAAKPAGPEQRQRAVGDVHHVGPLALEQRREPAAGARVEAVADEPAGHRVARGRELLAHRTGRVQVDRPGRAPRRIECLHQQLDQALRAAHRHGGLEERDADHARAATGPLTGAARGRDAASGAARVSRGRST